MSEKTFNLSSKLHKEVFTISSRGLRVNISYRYNDLYCDFSYTAWDDKSAENVVNNFDRLLAIKFRSFVHKLKNIEYKREIPESPKEKEEVSAYSEEFYSRIKNYPDLPK